MDYGRMRGMSYVILGLYLGNNPDTRQLGNSYRNCIFCTGNLIVVSVKVAIHSRRSHNAFHVKAQTIRKRYVVEASYEMLADLNRAL
ncbi:hypothetical protein [Anaplasma phagocytophilum]|uniref:hypothetical protein n=1 Tax=Anaplasma phagocytophilum TaxID=948 RepID=UPI00200C83F7|nr:hypothetical protein [Anaplasma phagocytophilum]UQD53927.1 hypothetical protein ESP60_00185 [Anaplasma phagocytophilum]UQD53932.1 hypothetical protein ESP60_00245 [Anaplasma phagocytophilum]